MASSLDQSKLAAKSAGRVLLPNYVIPVHYDIKIKPDLTNFIFDGVVKIDMTTSETMTDDESTKITLHSNELLYRNAQFTVVSDAAGATGVVKADEVSNMFKRKQKSLIRIFHLFFFFNLPLFSHLAFFFFFVLPFRFIIHQKD